MIALRPVLIPLLLMLGSLLGLMRNSEAQTLRPTATFVKDLGGVPYGSNLSSLTTIGGVVYFSACTPATGCELWKSNGTTQGTTLVKDIATGSTDATPGEFTGVNGTVFFVATDSETGRELWKTDGTAAGTTRVKDIAPGSSSSGPAELTNVGGTLFFVAADAAGRELWKSDGTEAGTVRVKDIWPGPDSGVRGPVLEVNGILFLGASNGTNGEELWKSDGTEAGTVQIVDTVAGPGSSTPSSFVNFNGTLYFTQADSSTGRELWKSNGTPQGTILVKDVVPGPTGSIGSLMGAGGMMYFMAQTSAHGREWWKSDGTESGTTLIKDVTPGPQDTVPAFATVHRGILYFFTRYGFEGQLWRLWRSDGSDGGTVILKEDMRDASGFAALDFRLFFTSFDAGAMVLWRLDGALGITAVKRGVGLIAFSASASVNGLLLFSSTDLVYGAELWKTDETDAGTVLVADINPTRDASIRSVTAADGVTFFIASPTASPGKLWRTDGTPGATARVSDVEILASNTPDLAYRNGALFFSSEDASGRELWKSDGSTNGTALLKDIWPGLDSSGRPRSSQPTTLMATSESVLFSAENENGRSLWKTDGSVAGTVPVFGSSPSPFATGSHLLLRAVLNNSVFLVEYAGSASIGRLWKSDGTPGGTIALFDQYSSGLTVVGNALYFASGRSLYKTDGTPGGTTLVASLGAPSSTEQPSSLTNVNGTLFFTHEGRLWKSDGVTTDKVPPGAGLPVGDSPQLTAVGGTLFLRSTDAGTGVELWKSDGTPTGTVLVKDIRPGPGSSEPFDLTSVGTHLFFTADDGVHGRELWASDGTEAGTIMVKDIMPGATGSIPQQLARSGNILFFTANDLTHGRQLWRATPDGLLPLPADTDGDGLPNTWEMAFGLNPQIPTGLDGADGDPDADGRSNLQEYTDGTHPKVATTLSVNKTRLHFGAIGSASAFTAQTPAQDVLLRQQGSGTLAWSVVSDQPWVQVSPASGSGPTALSISVRPDASLSPSGGTQTVRFVLNGSDRPFHEIAITLDLKAASGSSAPIGLVDTPTENLTGVTGSLPFTGWAVDDVDVTRVTICRAAVGAEVAPMDPNCGGTAKIFVGSAVFIDGARPDVEIAAAGYPQNSRAGWGFMLLTNTLPNQGNGTFTFSAYAADVEGRTTLLGTRTMTCDNAHATLPFGTIDTPTQGGAASGTIFVNFGWALTQNPKSIPIDGSTITAYVDGVSIGTVDYNHHRPDIAATFPGLANSNGAVGLRLLDTTQLTDGLHTIAWTVTDDSGATAGIGSRFFSVATTTTSQGSMVAGRAAAAAAALDAHGVAALDLASVTALPRDERSLIARRGWNLEKPWSQFSTGHAGRAVIRGEELDRFELWLDAGNGASYTGYLRTGDTLAPLPAGSQLRPTPGSFTWAPGAGFVGTYDLVFVQWQRDRAVARRDVRIVIAPKGSGHVGLQLVIDTPRAGASLEQPFLLAGWAADLDATSGSGIDTLHAWAYPLAGGPPIFLGTPALGGQRPDVAAIHGDQFAESGFGVMVQALAAGDYDVAVFPWSHVIGGFAPPQVVRVTVR